MKKSTVCSLLVAILLIAMSACAARKRIEKVSNLFLEDVNIDSTIDNLPFEHAWISPKIKKAEFRTVYFKPVRVDVLPSDKWERSESLTVESKDDYFAKAKEIAAYFHQQLVEKTKASEKQKLTVVDFPEAHSFVVEIVLTELELSHPMVRAGALIAPFPGTGPAVASISDPHVAFAARLTDGVGGQLVATAADRKFAPLRLVDLNKLTVSSSAREIVSLWSDSIAAALQGDGFTEIEEKNFEWLPW